MGNYKTSVTDALALVSGPLYAENLLSALKDALITDNVLKKMFGDSGERIFISKIPNYNDKIVPLIEFWWTRETFQSRNTRLSGTIDGRIVLPVMAGTDYDPNYSRRMANAFQRFLGSDSHDLFDNVPGLISIGENSDFRYSQLMVADNISLPAISFSLPILLDLHLMQLKLPDVDWAGTLDAEEFGMIETYRIEIDDENLDVLIPEADLAENT